MDIFSKYKLGVWGIVILLILNIGLMSVLWYEHFKKPEYPPPMRDDNKGEKFLIEELNLTEEQTAVFQSMMKQHSIQKDVLRAEIHKKVLEINSEIFNPEPDTARVRILSEEIGQKQAEFERSLFQHFSELKSICRPDQQERLQSIIHEILERNKPNLPPPPPGHQPPQDRLPPPPPRDGK